MAESSRIFLLKHSAWGQDLIMYARASQHFLEEPRVLGVSNVPFYGRVA